MSEPHKPRPKSESMDLNDAFAVQPKGTTTPTKGSSSLVRAAEREGAQNEEPPTTVKTSPTETGRRARGGASAEGVDELERAGVKDPAPRELFADLSDLGGADALLAKRPAEFGWQGAVNKATFGLLKLKPSADELVRRRGIERIQSSIARPMTILLANAAGGAGKTITAVGLAGTFGIHRGGEVVVWDNNETQGSLSLRTKAQGSNRTVLDLLGAMDDPERMSLGDVSPFLRRQGNARFEVLASSTDPVAMTQIKREQFNRVHRVLTRFKQLVIIDSGNNCLAENFVAAAETADLLVIPTGLQRADVQRALWTLQTLHEAGYERLVENAVVVISESTRGKESAAAAKEFREVLSKKLDIIEVPYDPHLDRGTVVDMELLADKTRRAYENLAALVTHKLSKLDN